MRFIFSALIFFCLPIACWSQEKKQAKPDPVFANVPDVPGLPRVLIIGDSISMGYTLPVRKLLEGKANVHRVPENGGDTANGIAKLDKWLSVNGSNKWDIIHFNWGLHDLKVVKDGHQVSPEQYEKNLRELVARMRATGAKLIWATTTPVPEGKVSPVRRNEDVLRYNQIAAKIMADESVIQDDLYAASLAHQKEWQRPANVHYTDQGSKALAELVHQAILKQLNAIK